MKKIECTEYGQSVMACYGRWFASTTFSSHDKMLQY